MLRYLREILNLFAYFCLLGALALVFYVLRDLRLGQAISTAKMVEGALFCLPYFLLLVSGWALSAVFFTELVFGTQTHGRSRNFSKERALARDGKGKDAALGLLWRDRVWGDPEALFAVLEMAQWDPALGPEAVQAAHRLIGSIRTSAADRDHAGRMLAQAKVSTVKPSYEWR